MDVSEYIAETNRLKAWQERDPDAALGHFGVFSESESSPVGNPHWERHLRVIGCDYRGPRVSTGCSCRYVCYQGKGYRGQATYGECLECIGVTPNSSRVMPSRV